MVTIGQEIIVDCLRFCHLQKRGHDAKHMEMEGRQTLSDQIADPSDAPVIRINLFEVDPADPEPATRL